MKNTQHTSQHDDQKMIRTESELSPEEFADFFSFLKNIQTHFNDFCVFDGTFRSKTIDRTCVVETGFPYFSKMNFNLFSTKKSANMLSVLDRKSGIIVTVDDDKVTFADKYQEIQFRIGRYEYLDNKFISVTEMENIHFKKIDPDRLFLRESLPKTTVSRINKMLREQNTAAIRVTHVENTLNMVFFQISEGSQGSGFQNYQMKLNKPLLLPMKKGHYFDIACMPFEFCKDFISLNFYFTEDENIIHLIYNTVVNNLFVNIYARATLIEEGTG